MTLLAARGTFPRQIFWTLSLTLFLGASTGQATDQGSEVNPSPLGDYKTMVKYKCDSGFDGWVRYEGRGDIETATLIEPDGRELVLSIQPAGSGVLYSNGKLNWHTKGQEAVATVEGTDRVMVCKEIAG